MKDQLTWTGSLSAVDMGQLRCFVMAVDCRSLSAAAKALDISQPAISKKLQKLEHAVAVPLLERTPRGVQPTVYGSAYYTHARAVLDELDRGGVDLLRLKGQAPSELRIGATPSLMELILPHAIAQFSAEWPSVHFRVRHGDHETLVRQLERRQVDCLLTVARPRAAIDDVESKPIAQSAQRGYVRRDHPLAKVATVTFEAMQSSRWILHDLPLYRESFRTMFESVALPAPQPTVLSQSLRFLLAMTQRADLVAFMPEHLAYPAVKAGRLVQLKLPVDPWIDDIVVYFRRQFADSLAMASLIDHCQQVCHEYLGSSAS
ncbi:MAG: LysR family transcriptional regulator [Pseudomonadota bacterium]